MQHDTTNKVGRSVASQSHCQSDNYRGSPKTAQRAESQKQKLFYVEDGDDFIRCQAVEYGNLIYYVDDESGGRSSYYSNSTSPAICYRRGNSIHDGNLNVFTVSPHMHNTRSRQHSYINSTEDEQSMDCKMSCGSAVCTDDVFCFCDTHPSFCRQDSGVFMGNQPDCNRRQSSLRDSLSRQDSAIDTLSRDNSLTEEDNGSRPSGAMISSQENSRRHLIQSRELLTGRQYSRTDSVGSCSSRKSSDDSTSSRRDSRKGSGVKKGRVVLLGAGGVGKSCLVRQFLKGTCPSNYTPTVEDNYRSIVQLPDGFSHSIEILDTAGLHQFPAMRQLSIQSGAAFVVVYAVDDLYSFQHALDILDDVINIKGGGQEYPLFLVGNKADSESRVVEHAEACSKALERNVHFLETSAVMNTNVKQVFMELLSKVFIVEEKVMPNQGRLSRCLSRKGSSMSVTKSSRNSDDGNNNINKTEKTCTIL